MENGCPIHIFPYTILVIIILGKHFLRPEEALTEIRRKLVFLTKLSSVQEKIDLKHTWFKLKLN